MENQFCRANLQNADFKGKNLAFADFSYADIRGADFSNAILANANFSHVKSGLPTLWTIILVILLVVLALLAGLVTGYASAIIGDSLSNKADVYPVFGTASLIFLGVFGVIIFFQGLGAILAISSGLITAFLILVIAIFPNQESKIIVGAVFTIIFLTGIIAGIVNIAVAVAISRVMAFPGGTVLSGCMAFLGAIFGAVLGVSSELFTFLPVSCIILIGVSLGIYIGVQATKGNKKYWLIQWQAIAIVTKKGTCFRHADLTDADFSQGMLKNADFRGANLTRTCWFQAQHLNQSRLEGTYLKAEKIFQLAVTKNGVNGNFNRLNIRSINLENAQLQNASFIGADLSEANLQNANLTGAKLANTQLYQAILTDACLTGACIENWGISSNTKREGIKCDYIYMQLPTPADLDPCRKPDNRQETFKPGDFADFISPIIKTLDLYRTQNIDPRQIGKNFKTLDIFHHEKIDPTAVAISILQLIDNNPEAELELLLLEGSNQEKVRFQARVADSANRSKLSSEYFESYDKNKLLSESEKYTLLLKEKDERISSLEKLLENAISQPKFYVETYKTQGEFVMSQSKGNISVNANQSDVSGIVAAGEDLSITGAGIGLLSGNLTNTVNQTPDLVDPETPKI